MDSFIIDIILKNKDSIIEKWLVEVEKTSTVNRVSSISREVFKSTNLEFVDLIVSNIKFEQDTASEELKTYSDRLIKLGWPLDYITEGLQVFRRAVLKEVFEDEGVKSNGYEIINNVDKWIDPIINQMVTNYSGSWENIVNLQKVALQELSSPLIPLLENITVMPLIGTIDTDRAKLIMENLLEGVVKHRSEVVLIDITGVPVVDTMVAHHIIQAVDAVRLIGAKAILVGIRPEIAQTIVNLGIDLSTLPTKSSMKKGIEAALKITNREIIEIT